MSSCPLCSSGHCGDGFQDSTSPCPAAFRRVPGGGGQAFLADRGEELAHHSGGVTAAPEAPRCGSLKIPTSYRKRIDEGLNLATAGSGGVMEILGCGEAGLVRRGVGTP